MQKRGRAFLLLSLTIAMVDAMFVYMNNHFAEETLHESLHVEGERLRASFDTLLIQTYVNMRTMATFISHDEEVQSLFLAGKKAVEEEGGGAGGPKSAAIRRQLFEMVGPNWQEVQKDHQVRQLHFHLGPGSTSFLRVHRPEKFGDNMDNVRFTIVDTNREQTPRVGFETGRVYAGLRGVVPVSAWDEEAGERTHVGALEVGTSFRVMLDILDQQYDLGIGILLSMDHINSAMWPDFIKRRFGLGIKGCDCVLEAASRKGVGNIIRKELERGVSIRDSGTEIIELNNTFYAVSHFPLRDYAGQQDATKDAVGAVLFWRNADEQMTAFNRAQLFNIIYGVLGFLLIELVLFFAFRFALRKLEGEVALQTVEQRKVKLRLSDAQRIAHLGNWEWSIVDDTLWWSDEVYRIIGVEPQIFDATFEVFMSVVHPEDREQLLKSIDDALYKGQPYHVIHRMVLADGSEKTVSEQGEVIFDKRGQPLKMRGAVQDITAQKRVEDELKENRQQLKSEVAIKDRLFSLIAHDLRGPFNTLLGMTRLISTMNESYTREEIAEFAKHTNEAGNRVFELLRNLLDWSQLQMKGVEAELEVISLWEVVEENIELLQPVAQSKGVALANEIGTATAFADRYMVQTVIRNLISNALKFTPSGGTIEILARQYSLFVHVLVADSGVGMTAEQMAAIFKLDKNSSTAGTEGEKGTGLGLPFCREMLEKHGCDIWVESVVGKGSTFTFSIHSGDETSPS